MRYDRLVLSPAREGAKSTRGWGRVGAKEAGGGGGGGGRVERERKRRGETPPSAWSDHHRILLGHFQTTPSGDQILTGFRNRPETASRLTVLTAFE